jgi:hypothetical protein
MTRVQVAELVMMLLAAYPQHRVSSEATSKVYESMLADLDHQLARKAITRLISLSKFMPTIAEIRTCVSELQHGPIRTGGEAWGDVLSEIRRIGVYAAPRFADPIVADLVKRWGWRALCDGHGDADRARFIDTYDAIAARARADVVSGIPLPAAGANRELKEAG